MSASESDPGKHPQVIGSLVVDHDINNDQLICPVDSSDPKFFFQFVDGTSMFINGFCWGPLVLRNSHKCLGKQPSYSY